MAAQVVQLGGRYSRGKSIGSSPILCNMKKQYVIKKYVMASNAREALRLESKIKADEVWIDEAWKDKNPEVSTPCGFRKK